MASTSAGTHRLTHAFDAGFSSGAPPPDSPSSAGDVGEEELRSQNDAELESRDSEIGDSNLLANLSSSIRDFSESFLRMEVAEMEMLKAREASRIGAEKRRAEVELKIAEMVAKTQLQIASFVLRNSQKRKRKRAEEEGSSSAAERQSLLLLCLLHSNLDFGLDGARWL